MGLWGSAAGIPFPDVRLGSWRFYIQRRTLSGKGGLCLVLLQVLKYFVPVQMFWASPNIWLHLVILQKLLCQQIKQFYWMQIITLSGTKCMLLAQYVNKFFCPTQTIWTGTKHFGTCKRTRHKFPKSAFYHLFDFIHLFMLLLWRFELKKRFTFMLHIFTEYLTGLNWLTRTMMALWLWLS